MLQFVSRFPTRMNLNIPSAIAAFLLCTPAGGGKVFERAMMMVSAQSAQSITCPKITRTLSNRLKMCVNYW